MEPGDPRHARTGGRIPPSWRLSPVGRIEAEGVIGHFGDEDGGSRSALRAVTVTPGYFGFCQTPRVLTNLEAWIRRRLRLYLWRQWRNGHNRFTELRRLGIAKFAASVAAGSPTGLWRMSGHPAVQHALRNHVFDSLGLPRIHVPVPA